MRRFIVSVVMLLGLAANAGTFVTGNPSLPPPKVDKIPPPADTTRYIVAADVNNLWGAAFDLRSSVVALTNAIYRQANICDYESPCPNAPDDNAGIAGAIAALPSGGKILIPAGSFKFNLSTIKGGLVISGAGSGNVNTGLGGTVISPADPSKPIFQFGDGVSTTSRGNKLENVLLLGDGLNTTGDGIYLFGVRDFRTDNVVITAMGRDGIRIQCNTMSSSGLRFLFTDVAGSREANLRAENCSAGPSGFTTDIKIIGSHFNSYTSPAVSLYLDSVVIGTVSSYFDLLDGAGIKMVKNFSSFPGIEAYDTNFDNASGSTAISMDVSTVYAANARLSSAINGSFRFNGQVIYSDATVNESQSRGAALYQPWFLNAMAFNSLKFPLDETDTSTACSLSRVNATGSNTEALVMGNCALRTIGTFIYPIQFGSGQASLWRDGSGMLRYRKDARNPTADTNGVIISPVLVTPTYGTSVTIDTSLGNVFNITATNGTAFTILNPSNAQVSTSQSLIDICIINSSGGQLGTITWSSNYTFMAAGVIPSAPANGTRKCIEFRLDTGGTTWFETWRSARFDAVVSVKDYGAVGDGSTEDAPAFQAATAAACISLRAVFIPAGTYKVSSTINGCSQLLVFGEGVNSLIRSNITDGTPVLKFTNAQFWKLRDFAIGSFANLTNIANGTASPQNCTGVQGTTNSTRYEIDGVRVWGMAIGYDITGWIGTLTNVWAQWDGIGLNGNSLNGVTLNVHFEANNQDFAIVNSSGISFDQILAEGTNTNAVASTIDNSNAITMVSPYFEGPGSGLLGRNAPFLTVGGTTIVQNFTVIAGTFYSGGFNWGVPAISLDRVSSASIDATIGTNVIYRPISTTANTKDFRMTANTNTLMPTNVGTDNSLQIGTAWNYWPNRRFDLWYRGWFSAVNGRSTVSLDTTNVRGTNALKITTQAGQNFNYHNLKLQGPVVTALRGKTLRLGVWMWVPNTAAYDESVWVTNPSCTTCMFPAIQLTSFNGSVQISSPTDNHHTARGQWNFLVTELALQSDATQIQIFLYANDSSNNGTGAESVTIGSVTLTDATTPVSRQFNDSLVDSPLIPAIGVGGQMIATGSAIPTDVNQTYAVGDRVLNTSPASGSPEGWVNTVAGSPGTWVALANVGTAAVQAPDFTTAGRTALAYVAGTSDTTLSTLGMGAITNPSNANNSYANDASTDVTRQMIKGAVTASGTAAAWGNVTTTRRQYLPKFTAKVYVPSLGTSNGQDREVFAGLKSTAPSTTGTGSDCAAQSNTNTGAWICYANATLAAYASGVNWMYVRDDGTTAVNTDSGIAVTVGLHTLVVDYTVAGQVTMSVDGSGAATFTTNLGTASTPFGPVISCGTWATLAGYSCSTPGFQVVQSF